MDNRDFALAFVEKLYTTMAIYQRALEIYLGKVELYPQGRNIDSEIAINAKMDQLLDMYYWMQDELVTVVPGKDAGEFERLASLNPEELQDEITMRKKKIA